MTDPSEYFLTEDQLRARFDERVREFVFGGFEPQAQPVLVLLGGQPAAGKSQAMAATGQRHGGRIVLLTGDELRPLHPRYRELLDQDAQTRETATAQASGAWVRMSIEHALREGYSLLLEGVFRDPAMTLATAEQFARAGVVVELVALAVREERSRLDAVDRFLEGGRWTPPDLQDLAYRMVPQTVAAAEQSPAISRIVITNRAGRELYVNERDPAGRWKNRPAAVHGLTNERALPFPPEEAAQWLAKDRTVVVEMAARGETNDASRPVLRRLTQDAEVVAPMAHPDPTSPVRLTHRAAHPLLLTLIEGQINGSSLPVELLVDPPSTAQGRAEASRRERLPPVAKAAEDEVRSSFATALRWHEDHSQSKAADRTAGKPEPRRPNPSAARARSTTVRGRSAQKGNPQTPPGPGGPQPLPTEHRKGRGR
ncbi:zeta toxin family protein [Streptomyces sp. NPDC020858]|uniref:zeta toxin family protein n=1 Tax=Streptomyces sp. NPDC020858 TaxID=3365097 RepID=UPI0037AABBFF